MLSRGSIDKRSARRAFERAAAAYDQAAVLQREIADRVLERLECVRLDPRVILDLGTGTGYAIDALRRRFRKAHILAVDFAIAMLHQARHRGSWLNRPHCICADVEALPIADATVDLVFSSATLQWCNDLPSTFGDLLRVLRPGGLLMFTTFGPDTLRELREAWATVDGHTPVSPFADMHDIGDALMRARFADPVMETERLTVTYRILADLMSDLKVLGARNVTTGRPRGLTGRRHLACVEQVYEDHRRDGKLPASYEVVYGHAWAPQTRPVPGGVAIPVSAIGRRGRA
jgi:malonyl-CoA O-methyltransferase